jgi:precorrin-6B methylase 2
LPSETNVHIFVGRIEPNDVLVDVGCGKGRVTNWWLSQGLRNRMVGIELDPDVASATEKRLRRFSNVTILNEDATAWMPDDASPRSLPASPSFCAGSARKSAVILQLNESYDASDAYGSSTPEQEHDEGGQRLFRHEDAREGRQ